MIPSDIYAHTYTYNTLIPKPINTPHNDIQHKTHSYTHVQHTYAHKHTHTHEQIESTH